jgi:hypothetical protein
MDDDTAKKNEGLRELVLRGIGYSDVDLPTSGKVKIHPYISTGAMGAYESVPDDAKAAFQAMFVESREAKETAAPELTDDDADVIARLYAKKEGFIDGYATARVTSPPFAAFAQAIKDSVLWRDRLESHRQLEAMIAKQARIMEGLAVFPRGLEATVQNLARQIEMLPRVTASRPSRPTPRAISGSRRRISPSCARRCRGCPAGATTTGR